MRHESLLPEVKRDIVALKEAKERAGIVYRYLVRKGLLHFSQDEADRLRLWAKFHLRTRKPEAITKHYKPILDRLDSSIWKQQQVLETKLDDLEALEKRTARSAVPMFIRSGKWKDLHGAELENAVKSALRKSLKADFSYKPIDETIRIITELRNLDINAAKKRLAALKQERDRVAQLKKKEVELFHECQKYLADPKVRAFYRLALMEPFELSVYMHDAAMGEV